MKFKLTDLPAVIAAILAALYSYAAILKLSNVSQFRAQLDNQVLPEGSSEVLVWLIPVAGLLVCLLLVFQTTRYAGFCVSTVLLSLFSAYMALVVLDFFDRVPCSCGGILGKAGFEVHLAFNLFFMALSLMGIVMFHAKPKHIMT